MSYRPLLQEKKNVIYIIDHPTTITDIADGGTPNPVTSIISDIYGTNVIPMNTFVRGYMLHYYVGGLASYRNLKTARITFGLNDDVANLDIQYGSNTSDVGWKLEFCLSVTSVIDNVATIRGYGYIIGGSGPAGATATMRYLDHTYSVNPNLNTTISSTFVWGDANRNVLNTLTVVNGYLETF